MRDMLDLMNDLELFFEALQGCFEGLHIIRYVASHYQAVFTVEVQLLTPAVPFRSKVEARTPAVPFEHCCNFTRTTF